jgi:hypothetical protein
MAMHPLDWFGSRFPSLFGSNRSVGKTSPAILLFGAKRSERRPHQRLCVMRRTLRYASLNSIFIGRRKFTNFCSTSSGMAGKEAREDHSRFCMAI